MNQVPCISAWSSSQSCLHDSVKEEGDMPITASVGIKKKFEVICKYSIKRHYNLHNLTATCACEGRWGSVSVSGDTSPLNMVDVDWAWYHVSLHLTFVVT